MKLLVTSAFGGEERLDALRALGHDVLYVDDERGALPEGIHDVDGVVCNALFMHHDVDRFTRLRFVQLTSAGLDRAPVERFRERGVQVFNAGGVYSVPMAEWAVAQILQIYKGSRRFLRQQDARQWVKQRDLRELAGRTACIVGFGDVGQEVAKRLRAFDVRILAVGTTAPDASLADEFFTPDAVGAAFAAADVVVLCVPLTPDTRHLINDHTIAAMKPDAVLVNVSRGAVVDEHALDRALDRGRFLGVALDVFEAEPLPADSPLWGYERVLLTPHNAFASDRVQERLLQLVVRNLGGV